MHRYAVIAAKGILDTDLTAIYGVPTERLNEQYRRHLDRFPEDFAFQLAQAEWAALRSQMSGLAQNPRNPITARERIEGCNAGRNLLKKRGEQVDRPTSSCP